MSSILLMAAFPVIIIAIYIYSKDKDKEPKKTLLKFFTLGLFSPILTIIFTCIVGYFLPIIWTDTNKLNYFELIINVFVGVALIEEYSKWILLYRFGYKEKNFNELYDMIIYATYVSLGFAFSENILYVAQHGMSVVFVRSFLAVPGHAFYGVSMGYYLGLANIAKQNNNKSLESKNKLLSLLSPVLLHGIYDYCLFTENLLFIIAFFIFVILLYIYGIKKIKKVSEIEIQKTYINKYCTNCGRPVDSEFCPQCGNKNA